MAIYIHFFSIWIAMISIRYFTLGELPPHISTIGTYLLSLIFSFIIWFLFNFCFGLIAFLLLTYGCLNMFKGAIVRFVSGAITHFAFTAFIPANIRELPIEDIVKGIYQGLA